MPLLIHQIEVVETMHHSHHHEFIFDRRKLRRADFVERNFYFFSFLFSIL